jgi:hypothetical protein
VDEDRNFIIQSATPGALIIPGKLTGAGTLEVVGAVTDITIGDITRGGGNGSIRFTGAAVPTAININSTGTVTFDNVVTGLTGAASTIAGDVVFKDDVSTAHALNLLGNVTLLSGNTLTLGAPATSLLTLGAGKTVSVQFTPRNADDITAPVLIAGPEPVVLTPGGNGAILTVPNDPTQTTDAAINAAKKLTLSAQALEITDGVLQVAPDATLAVDAVALSTKLATTPAPLTIGYLALADGGALSLLTGGTVDIGDTVISVVSTLKAGGGTVTLGNDKIAGSVAGAALTATSGAPVFTLATTKLLILEQADLNLAANGSVVITDPARVILTEQGKITLNNGEGGKETIREKIGDNGFLSGGFVGITAPTAPDTGTGTQPVWSVAHRDAAAADVGIAASGANVTLSKSSTSFK